MRYDKMTLAELRNEMVCCGINPVGMKKADMVQYLTDREKASKMSLEELEAILKQRGKM